MTHISVVRILALISLLSIGIFQTKVECKDLADDDTLPANDEELQKQASEIQRPEEQFVYNPYGVNDYRLGQLFGQPEQRKREPFYFYTRDEDEEIETVDDVEGPIEPFSFNEERINLENFERKKKLGDPEFENLERGDYLDPSNVRRDSFLVVTGGLFPNNDIFADVPQLNFGKKAEKEFERLRNKFRSSLRRYPPYYLNEPEYDPYEQYDPYAYEPPQREYQPEVIRPTLPPYTQPPPRKAAKKRVQAAKKKPKVGTRRLRPKKVDDIYKIVEKKERPKPRTRKPKKRPTRPPRTTTKRLPTTTKPPPKPTPPPTTRSPSRARSFPVDIIDDLGIFGRRIDVSAPKITPGDKIDRQFYGKAKRRKNQRAKKRKKVEKDRRQKVEYQRPKVDTRRRQRVTTKAPDDAKPGVARVYHYSTFGNSGNMRGFAYTIVV